MKHLSTPRAFVLLCLAVAPLAAGCRPSARPADPEKGREALRAALAAWQKGETADALRGRSPAITAADRQWQGGYRLVRYEIDDDVRVVGYDLQCRAVLWLEGPDGRPRREQAVFSVSTHPAIVVIRSEG
jgi:hypothetical protein